MALNDRFKEEICDKMEEIAKARAKSPNENHPETIPGERWVTNSGTHAARIEWGGRPDFRIGKTAYDVHGKPIDGMVPVFRKNDTAPQPEAAQ